MTTETKQPKMLTKISVRPFSAKDYHKNSNKCPIGSDPCAICGRGIVRGTEKFCAVVTEGGGAWGDASSNEEHPGYMGIWPVGPDCAKRYAVSK